MGVLEKIPELGCTVCKRQLRESDNTFTCGECGNVYEITDGIPNMLAGDMKSFAREIAVQDSVAAEYENKRYDQPYAKRYHGWWTERMLKFVKRDGRFLDNGCGIGLLCEKLDTKRIVGLDISSEMLKTARRKNEKLVLGNSQQLPFQDNSFDVVFCRSLIHHLPEPELAVMETARVLKPGGEAVFVDTNASLLSRLPRYVANRGEHFSEDHKNLNRKIFEKIIRGHLEIEVVDYFGYVAYPVLGFPDILQVFKYFPAKRFFEGVLMGIDAVISKIPLLRTQSWAILVKCRKSFVDEV